MNQCSTMIVNRSMFSHENLGKIVKILFLKSSFVSKERTLLNNLGKRNVFINTRSSSSRMIDNHLGF